MFLAGAAALPLAAGVSAASAQQYVGQDGRALDASNQIGSGGINQPTRIMPQVTGNEIVTGNVTGGFEFRGNVPYTDPQAFRGDTAGQVSDRFVRHSAGVPTPGIPQPDLTRPQPFYGESRAAPPPPGFTRQGYAGGYIPAEPVLRQPGDARLGRPIEAPAPLPRPGQLIMPGPVDPADQQQTFITASPLYGIRQWRTDDPDDVDFLANYTVLRPDMARARTRLDAVTLQRLRQELERTIVDEEVVELPRAADEVAGRQALRPFESPEDPDLGERDRTERMEVAGRPLAAGMETEQGARQRLLVPAARQSEQVAELQRRLERYYAERRVSGDEQAAREFARQLHERREAGEDPFLMPGLERPEIVALPEEDPAEEPAEPQGLERFGIPDFTRPDEQREEPRPPVRVDPLPEPREPAVLPEPRRPEPLEIRSLAEGVHARGLEQILRTAEERMREGKFTAALEQYAAAEQVAPNNPLVRLGQAHAELGASYYARAERNLREALTADPLLLMGRYDLQAFYGEDRLRFLVNDLKEITQAEPGQARPAFLLAYVAYNTGNARQAAEFLDLAEQRAGGRDPVIRIVRQHWTLPAQSDGPAVPDLPPATPADGQEASQAAPDLPETDPDALEVDPDVPAVQPDRPEPDVNSQTPDLSK